VSGSGDNAFAVIEAPPATPPRVSLLSSARVVDDDSRAWQNGITFAPEQCREPDAPYWWECPGPAGVDPRSSTLFSPTGEKEIDASPEVVQYRPWTAQVGDKCSTFGWQARDFVGRARRLLQAAESRIVERELLLGTIAAEADFPNRALTGPGVDNLTPGTSSSPLVYALTALQEAIAEGQNGRGMIHATIPTVQQWLAASAIRREGNLYFDAVDNIVVPGQGYDGTGPCLSQIDSIAVDATGGTWELVVNGDSSTLTTLGFAITAAALQALLAARVDIGAGVTVSGGPGDAGGTTPYVIDWSGSTVKCEPVTVATVPTNLTGGASTAVVTNTQAAGSNPPDSTGETAWAFATGIVEVRRAGIVVVPDDLTQALDRQANLIEWRAERTVAAYWDGCVHAAARVNLCEPCCVPS